MKIVDFLKTVARAQAINNSVDNPTQLAKRASIAAAIVAGVNMVVPVFNVFFNAQFSINPDDLSVIANAVTIAGVYATNKFHIAANTSAGK